MKKFLVIMLAMLWMSVAAFSQITISQEDYDYEKVNNHFVRTYTTVQVQLVN